MGPRRAPTGDGARRDGPMGRVRPPALRRAPGPGPGRPGPDGGRDLDVGRAGGYPGGPDRPRAIPSPGLKGRTYEAVGILEGTLEEASAIVIDYRSYQEFMPRTERTVVIDESDAVALVEQYLKLPLGVHKRYRLRYTYRKGDGGFRGRLGQGALARGPAEPVGRRHLGLLADRPASAKAGSSRSITSIPIRAGSRWG